MARFEEPWQNPIPRSGEEEAWADYVAKHNQIEEIKNQINKELAYVKGVLESRWGVLTVLEFYAILKRQSRKSPQAAKLLLDWKWLRKQSGM